MYEQPIGALLDRRKLLIAAPATRVDEAAKLMAKRKASAVLIVLRGRVAGIFTERDAVHRVIARRRDPRATTLAEVMTRKPRTVSPNETFGYAMLLMHKYGFRHLPVVENRVPVGVISARNALDPELEEFVAEAERRENIPRFARGAGRAARARA